MVEKRVTYLQRQRLQCRQKVLHATVAVVVEQGFADDVEATEVLVERRLDVGGGPVHPGFVTGDAGGAEQREISGVARGGVGRRIAFEARKHGVADVVVGMADEVGAEQLDEGRTRGRHEQAFDLGAQGGAPAGRGERVEAQRNQVARAEQAGTAVDPGERILGETAGDELAADVVKGGGVGRGGRRRDQARTNLPGRGGFKVVMQREEKTRG